MNHAQRRLAARQHDRLRAQRRIDPAAAWSRIKLSMLKSDRRDLDDASKRELLTAAYLLLQRLQFGGMRDDDFIDLCGLNAVAGEIAYQLQFHDDTGQISTAGHACSAAAEALAAIGLRRGESLRFVAAGDELRILREAVQYLAELLDLAPTGVIVAAMDKIQRNIERKLGQRRAA